VQEVNVTAVTAQHRTQEQSESSYEVATMLREAVANWWLLQIRGIMAVAFGLFLVLLAGMMNGLFTAAIALVAVLLIFVLYAMGSGILSIVTAVRTFGMRERFWAALVHGSLMLVLGIWVFFSDQVTILWLVWFMIVSALASGLLEIAFGRILRRHLDAKLLEAAGAMSVVCSILLFLARNSRLSSLVEGLGMYAIFYGGVLIALSLRLMGIGKSLRFHEHAAHSH
jgi:uncharacterized membrane protein HdeD (DUF308 family)